MLAEREAPLHLAILLNARCVVGPQAFPLPTASYLLRVACCALLDSVCLFAARCLLRAACCPEYELHVG